MKTKLTSRQRRQLEAGVSAKIREFEELRNRLRYVDREVFEAGVSTFGSAAVLAQWLCRPAMMLAGKRPLHVMHTAKGRKQVATLLQRIDYGLY